MRLRFVFFVFLALSVPSWNLPACSQVMRVKSGGGPAPEAVPTEAPIQSYHDGSIRDIGAIGNRNIGCSRGIGNWYSLERQIEMGKKYSDHVEATAKLIEDPEITEYVNRVGQNLVRNSDSAVPFTIKVIESDDVNAFALPGGFFYVDSGLILEADNEAELAGVMAHEIAHVAACHMARQTTRGKLMNLASVPLMMVGGPVGYIGYEALSIASPLTYLRFTRHFESEADFLGIQYMYKAGYDPQALTSFFEKIKSLESDKQSVVAKAFRTHPQTPDRIEKTQAEINTLLPPRAEYTVNTSEFEDAKARLRSLENAGHLQFRKTFQPTLRRRMPTEVDENPPDAGRDQK